MLSNGQVTHYFEISKRQISNIFNDLFFFFFFKVYLAVFLVLNISLWLAAMYIRKAINEPMIALHYNVDFGIDYHGSADKLFILPILGLTFFLVNVVLFSIVRNQKDRKFIGHILCAVAVLANLILLAGIASVYLINFR